MATLVVVMALFLTTTVMAASPSLLRTVQLGQLIGPPHLQPSSTTLRSTLRAAARSPHQAGDHELCTIADGVHSAVLDHQALEACQQTLQGHDCTA